MLAGHPLTDSEGKTSNELVGSYQRRLGQQWYKSTLIIEAAGSVLNVCWAVDTKMFPFGEMRFDIGRLEHFACSEKPPHGFVQ